MNPELNQEAQNVIKKAGLVGSDLSNINKTVLNRIAQGVPASTIENVSTPTVQTPEEVPVPDFTPVVESAQSGLQSAIDEQRTLQDKRMQQITDFDMGTQDQFESTMERSAREQGFGGVADLQKRLTDETTKLSQLQGKYRTQALDLQESGISQAMQGGIAGEMGRRQAIEVGNQALLVQALQGNMATAQQLARDVAELSYQDKKTELDALIFQYNAIEDRVTGKEKQMLEEQKMQAELERDTIERTRDLVDTAVLTGMASGDEMQRLTSPDVSDEEKQILAQTIMSRAGREDRYSETSSGGSSRSDLYFKFGQTEKRTLFGAGFTESDVQDIETAINELGLQEVLESRDAEGNYIFTDAEKMAISNAMKATPQLGFTVDSFKEKFDDNDVRKLIRQTPKETLEKLGITKGLFGGGISTDEVNNYIEKYLLQVAIPALREQGLTVDEIVQKYKDKI